MFEPCVYRLWSGDTLLYIGQTTHWLRRFNEHAISKPWWPYVTRYRLQPCASVRDAVHAEAEAIRTERPIFNIAHNDEAAGERQRQFWDAHPGPVPRSGYMPNYENAERVLIRRYGTLLPIRMTLPLLISAMSHQADRPHP